VEKEIDYYFQNASKPTTEDVNVLNYWEGYRDRMPRLASLARNIFHIPLGSVTSYRSHSTVESVYTEGTTLLDSDRAAEIIYCKENYFRLEPLMDEKEFESENPSNLL
jgi:hypothetical protein